MGPGVPAREIRELPFGIPGAGDAEDLDIRFERFDRREQPSETLALALGSRVA